MNKLTFIRLFSTILLLKFLDRVRIHLIRKVVELPWFAHRSDWADEELGISKSITGALELELEKRNPFKKLSERESWQLEWKLADIRALRWGKK